MSQLSELSSEEVFRIYATTRDRVAFDEFYRREHKTVRDFLRGYLKTKYGRNATQHTDDMLQNVFLAVVQRADQYAYPRPVRSWLFKIAQNRVKNLFRSENQLKRGADKTIVPLDDSRTDVPNHCTKSPEEIVWTLEIDTVLSQIVEHLPEIYRIAIRLHFYDGLSQVEAARSLSMARQTFNWRLHEALRLMRESFSERLTAVA